MNRETQSEGRLAEEIQQTKPFPALETEAYLNLVRTTAVLADQVAQLCKTEGVSEPQYNTMRILRGAGSGGLLCGEVAERLVSRLPDISRLLDRLHACGLIRKQSEQHDRRAVRVTLTNKGSRTLERLDQPLVDLNARQFSELSKKEQRTLIRLLERARHKK